MHDRARRGTSVTGPLTILFVCTGNSARSILAEAVTNQLAAEGGPFRAFSAGSHPKGEVHPLTLAVLREARLKVDGLRSKSWDEFAGPGAPPLDFVITVCDQAAAEPCPRWPGQPVTAHWGVPDPAAVTGSDDRRRRAFREALVMLERRVEQLASLPVETLDRQSLEDRLRRIGHE